MGAFAKVVEERVLSMQLTGLPLLGWCGNPASADVSYKILEFRARKGDHGEVGSCKGYDLHSGDKLEVRASDNNGNNAGVSRHFLSHRATDCCSPALDAVPSQGLQCLYCDFEKIMVTSDFQGVADVQLKLHIGTNGLVQQAEIVKATNSGIGERVAIAVSQLDFYPISTRWRRAFREHRGEIARAGDQEQIENAKMP